MVYKIQDEWEIFQTEDKLKILLFDMKMVLESDIFELGALNPKDDLSIYFAGSENNAFDGKSELCKKKKKNIIYLK